jgi:hypothetical protein
VGGLGTATEVTVGSQDAAFSQNKQNEPAVAIDASRPQILAAGANDNIDLELCNAGDDTTCPFTPNVGVTGVQFSLDGGATWVQPTYRGISARHCAGAPGPDPGCTTNPTGPIGTLPRYDELNLVSNGDPALAFGPRPGAGGFSWSNGSRLYVANIATNVTADVGEPGVKGDGAIAVSRTDDVAGAAAGNNLAWRRPVIASKQSSARFADKEQIWADNAASSRFFGNVYVCYVAFTGNGSGPLAVARSTNGGDTWSTTNVTGGANVSKKHFGQSGCTIRTDSTGVVYVFFEEFTSPEFAGLPTTGRHMLAKSSDGGRSFTKAFEVQRVVDPCYFVDPVIGRCVMDGIAGARNDLAAAPSVDIANGAPTGADATNLIVDTWADGRPAQDAEQVLLSYSRGRGEPGTWSTPRSVGEPGDRGYYAAPAVSPDGRDVYLVYNAFRTPFQRTTFTPRSLVGVVRHADVGTTGGPGPFTTLQPGVTGDPRASAQNGLTAEFLGDYVYAAATRTYGAGVWNDMRESVDCPRIDQYRMALRTGDPTTTPAPQQECPATWGNSDIWGGSYADPSTP